ncbi:MAG: tRNA preQ1(34) S-adenosylmethionine ribosyltransferase-isomerase QueA [Nitrospirae bacterium RBG_16_64_22]|nr:MAG: tRNA preQ1(34) S-adenosylmethionine ribosyltransferase-isomerase QueA [Nitrospirae bacterium RBG_16_64_22]
MAEGTEPGFFDYVLPEERIADRPASPRDAARLLVVSRATGALSHGRVRDLPGLLGPGDLVVLNDTKVVRARAAARKVPTGGRVELLFLLRGGAGRDDRTCEALARGAGRPGTRLRLEPDGPEVEVLSAAGGTISVRLPDRFDLRAWLEKSGDIPLPPYILRRRGERTARPEDFETYQTVYARADGSAAAPTAGLHFTPSLLAELEHRGIETASVTLHVGPATFRPLSEAGCPEVAPDPEWYSVPPETVLAWERARGRGGRIVAVGTTATRVLETVSRVGAGIPAGEGWTSLVIRPGHRFRVIDGLLTNFHLPRTSLLLLVSAFAGEERTRAAYGAAIREGYRFYSYGDAMLII